MNSTIKPMTASTQSNTNTTALTEQVSTWISVADTAALLKIRPATVISRIEKGTLKGKTPDDLPFTYDGKPNYIVQLECLPQKLQYRYIVNHLPEAELCAIDLASPRSKLGNIWIDQFMSVADIIREATKIRTTYHATGEVTKQMENLAASNGISLATLYRLLDQNPAKEISLFYVDPVYREDRIPYTMCLWSCDLALALHTDPDHRYSQNGIFEVLDKKRGKVPCSSCPYHPNAKPVSTVWKPPICPVATDFMRCPNNRKTVNRFLSHVPPQLLMYARDGYRQWKSEYGYFTMRDRPIYAGEVLVGDHHKFDLFVRITIQKTVKGKTYEKEIAVRPTLTAWMDAGTGCIVGWVISVMPNSDTIAEAFCRAVVVTPGEPFHGVPRAIYVDCGKDYKSQLLEDMPEGYDASELPSETMLNRRFGRVGLLRALGVEVLQHALPYHPQSKTIERTFGTLERGWISHLDGWCRNSVKERPYDFEQSLNLLLKTKKLLTLEEFVQYFQNIILPEYHGQIDESVTLAEIPGWELSGKSMPPKQLYQKLPKYKSTTPDWQTVSILKMHLKPDCRVYRQGVLFSGVYYQADELAGHVGEKVDILYHAVQPPYAPSSLTVILHTKNSENSAFEAFPDKCFKMVGEEALAIKLHNDVQERPRREYDRALKHIRMTTRSILPEDARSHLSDKTQLYDETYAPATLAEMEAVEAPSAEQPEHRRSPSVDVNKALEFLFGEE